MNESTRPKLAEPGQTVAPLKPIDIIRRDLDRMAGEFVFALPQHIPVDRFKRVVLTAINQNVDLLDADRKSLMGACMRAAQDGLFPDGREGALVIFNTKVRTPEGERWVKQVHWMPMVYGIIKKMRNSGELASIVAHEVYEKDRFQYRLGDEEMILHEPYIGDADPGKIIAVYAIAKLKDGTMQREVMTRAQVDKVRSISKSKDGPAWVNWYGEMGRKTVVRRLSKYLPMSTEIEDMLRRDDAISAAADTMKLNAGEALTIDGKASAALPDDSEEEAVRDAEREAERAARTQQTEQREPIPDERNERDEPPHDEETGEIVADKAPTSTKKTTTTTKKTELF